MWLSQQEDYWIKSSKQQQYWCFIKIVNFGFVYIRFLYTFRSVSATPQNPKFAFINPFYNDFCENI